MHTPIVHIFGNPDIAMDALPLRIQAKLEERFPHVEFRALDPNENWEIPDPFIVIDTVVGLSDIHVFRGLDEFANTPAVSVHDFDALTQLRFLKKLGKLGELIIIGVPPEFGNDESGALSRIADSLTTLLAEQHVP